jgi:hypothetical protein
MTTKKRTNKVVPVSLPQFHIRKLDLIRERTGLSYTGVIQRLIENYSLFTLEEGKERK